MAQQPWWKKAATGGKAGFDKVWQATNKLAEPVNKLSNKLGSEAFFPTTLDKESDKAARILKSFCKDGFYAEEEYRIQDGPKQKQKVLKKIPSSVIKNAKGLAIFTTCRTGLWVSGAGGSGVLIARQEDGSWSPPSGILLHTAGLGFLVGIDIYDCVIVINSDEALKAFTKIRATLGSEISVVAGPYGAGGILDTELHKRQAPIFTYLKSRGFYAGVQIDGTLVIERFDENERFYGQKLTATEILAGKVRHPPYEVRRLLETLKAAQGDTDVDESFIPTEAPPSDFVIDHGNVFSVPDDKDPDPYGVLALEKEGMSIKEAGTQKRASWEAFSFKPAPSSPVHDMVAARRSHDGSRTLPRRSSWRTSAFDNNEPKTPSSLRASVEFPRTSVVLSDSSTQTDDHPTSPQAGRLGYSRRSSKTSLARSSMLMQDVPEDEVVNTHSEPVNASHANGYTTPPHTPPAVNDETTPNNGTHDEPHSDEHLAQAAQTAMPQMVSKVRLVNVPKRIPPQLPPRNPNRSGAPLEPVAPKSPVVEAAVSPVTEPKDEEDAASNKSASNISLPEHQPSIATVDAGIYDVRLDDSEVSDSELDEKSSVHVAQAQSVPAPQSLLQQVRQGTDMPGGW